MKKILISIVFLVVYGICSKNAFATATLQNMSDTITTSRPSASAPLNADQSAAATQVTVVDNGSIYIASDSAQMKVDPVSTDAQTDAGLNVASMSAQISGSPNTRIIYITNSGGIPHGTHHKGDAFVVPITAMHTLKFTTSTTVPVSGKITITFPVLTTGDSNNNASPSASTFQFNGLSSANVMIFDGSTNDTSHATIAANNPSNGTSPTVTLTLDSSTSIASGDIVTIYLGCTGGTNASCTTQQPRILNPTKTAAAGTADNWKVYVTTRDVTNNIDLDTGRVAIGTIESVQVQAQVDPTLTFTIAGLANGTNFNTITSCPSESTNSGIGATATFVNLGTVGQGITIAGQQVTISTNGTGGYTLTATSSGTMINPGLGYSIVSSTTPGTMTAGTELFGIHPCGTDAAANFTPGSAVSGGGGGKVAWPTATTSLSLASRTTTASSISTGIEYAMTVSGTTPAGVYTSVITYVATPTFN